jgi:hypothetical protein
MVLPSVALMIGQSSSLALYELSSIKKRLPQMASVVLSSVSTRTGA